MAEGPLGDAVVIGSSGGLGCALVDRLLSSKRFGKVHALSRVPPDYFRPGEAVGSIDISDPESIAAAAAAIDGSIELLVVATGILHEEDWGPERSLHELDAQWLLKQYAVNAVGPAMVLKNFVPKLRKDGRAVTACLSARVGSIADNRLGGWYGYRASKAALNQIVKTAAIELARTHPNAICVALHPGTVDTRLSAPFQRAVKTDKLFTPDYSAESLLAVIARLKPNDSGSLLAWDGERIAP